VYALTNAAEVGVAAELARIELARPMLVQVREKLLDANQRLNFAREVIARVHAYGGQVLLNGSVDEALVVGADGVHLSAAALVACEQRPELPLVFASCHTPAELLKASSLALDAVVLGSIKETPTHPGAAPLGWAAFEQLISGYALPVYGIGGMRTDDVPEALAAGGQGVAMMRGW